MGIPIIPVAGGTLKKCLPEALAQRHIWQPRFWEHAIRNEEDYRRHMDYVYINPVKHAHVRRVQDWPYSTFIAMCAGDGIRRIGLVEVSEFDAGERR